MDYKIIADLIHHNRPKKPLKAEGIVIHATATPGATDEAEQKYFDRAERRASAHFFVDWDSITQLIPVWEQAWHAGPTANAHYLGVEMCEPKGFDQAKFNEVWARTVWLAADLAKAYNIPVNKIITHHMATDMFHESTHQDPDAYLKKYGKSFVMMKSAISVELTKMKGGK